MFLYLSVNFDKENYKSKYPHKYVYNKTRNSFEKESKMR